MILCPFEGPRHGPSWSGNSITLSGCSFRSLPIGVPSLCPREGSLPAELFISSPPSFFCTLSLGSATSFKPKAREVLLCSHKQGRQEFPYRYFHFQCLPHQDPCRAAAHYQKQIQSLALLSSIFLSSVTREYQY